MRFPRCSGILLHPTSFPSRYGIGEIGSEAYRFLDFLAHSGQSLWQVLPLGPTGYGDSPYQCFSAFAGNPLLLSLEDLVKEKLLQAEDIQDPPAFPEDKIDYGWVIPYKFDLLTKAYHTYASTSNHPFIEQYIRFCEWNWWWVNDYGLFMAVKNAHQGAPWPQWDEGIARREPDAIRDWTDRLRDEVEAFKFWQFLFYRQWNKVKDYAHQKGIQIIGDIPIYVAHDSADVWANQHLFHLDEQGNPTVVAGVPPDYFSETGQLWGNPIYRWDRMAEGQYQWWIERFKAVLNQVDIVRLDHFRGFEAFWQVPGTEKTAIHGEWVKGPNAALFEALESALGELPIIAENLGVITEEVEALRNRFAFPGMRILQFAFCSTPLSVDLPHNYEANTVAYSGTHDNDTTVGWWQSTGTEDSTRAAEEVQKEKAYAKAYLHSDGREIHWDFIRALMASVADMVVFPMQDLLGLGAAARMNFPGRPSGNWQWRCPADYLKPEIKDRMLALAEIYGRLAEDREP
ncbi:MAG: 4-alpha-glucanotransferase [bacterium]|jgi:4-alpha-glucanotransferase|nr:4-alpha-glucanotransferase [bacterium]